MAKRKSNWLSDSSDNTHTDKKHRIEEESSSSSSSTLSPVQLLFQSLLGDAEMTQIVEQFIKSTQWKFGAFPYDHLMRFRTRLRELFAQNALDPLDLVHTIATCGWQKSVYDTFPWNDFDFIREVNNWGWTGQTALSDLLASRTTDADLRGLAKVIHGWASPSGSTRVFIIKCALCMLMMREPFAFFDPTTTERPVGFRVDFFTQAKFWWMSNPAKFDYDNPAGGGPYPERGYIDELATRRVRQVVHMRNQYVSLANALRRSGFTTKSLINLVSEYLMDNRVAQTWEIHDKPEGIVLLTEHEYVTLLKTVVVLARPGQKGLTLEEAQTAAKHPDIGTRLDWITWHFQPKPNQHPKDVNPFPHVALE